MLFLSLGSVENADAIVKPTGGRGSPCGFDTYAGHRLRDACEDCRDVQFCFFAHSPEELRVPELEHVSSTEGAPKRKPAKNTADNDQVGYSNTYCIFICTCSSDHANIVRDSQLATR